MPLGEAEGAVGTQESHLTQLGGWVIKEGCLKEVSFKLRSEEHIGIFQAKGDGRVGRGQNALSREKA